MKLFKIWKRFGFTCLQLGVQPGPEITISWTTTMFQSVPGSPVQQFVIPVVTFLANTIVVLHFKSGFIQ